MKRLFLLFIIGILAILDSVISLHSISRVRISRSDLRVSTSSTGNRMDPSGTNTVTVNTGSLKKGQEEPIDYSHVEGQRNPEEWQTSVAPCRDVVYARALEVQMDMIRQLGMKEVEIEDRFKLRFSNVKQARIANMQYEGSRFRKVRLTYFDAGPNVQVFNALWMPSFEYDVPMLGVDLISLGKQRVLSVIDMQPLHPDEPYSQKYIQTEKVTGIRAKYPDLQGKLSGKIYDDTSFFSANMLFGRFTDETKLKPVVHPAHAEYLAAYHEMVASAIPNNDLEAMAVVRERQAAYDKYSAEKDPAVGLFDSYFGKEWSDAFVHNFLFSLCREGYGSEQVHSNPVHKFNINASDGTHQPDP